MLEHEDLKATMPWQVLKSAVGLVSGSNIQSVFDRIRSAIGLEKTPEQRSAQSRVAFTIAVVALAAKMSKADGVASEVEARVFERQFQVPEGECENVRRLYRQASQDVAGYKEHAHKVSRMLADEPELKISVMECLFHIATADGVLHPAEDQYLKEVASILGIADQEFNCLRRAFVQDPDSPYEVLNISPDNDLDAIKVRYRELVRAHHPDALIAKGVPEEFHAVAGRRLAAITGAYEAILVERGARAERALERGA